MRPLTQPGDILGIAKNLPLLVDSEQMHVYVIRLDTRLRLIDEPFLVGVGSSRVVVIEAMTCLRAALTGSRPAQAIILLFSHPSGDLNPSVQDRHLTDMMGKAADAVGLDLLDTVIVGREDGMPEGDVLFLSCAELGLVGPQALRSDSYALDKRAPDPSPEDLERSGRQGIVRDYLLNECQGSDNLLTLDGDDMWTRDYLPGNDPAAPASFELVVGERSFAVHVKELM